MARILGGQPALVLPARLALLGVALAAGLPAPALADTAGLLRCRALADGAQRLACFDALAEAAARAAVPAAAAATPPAALTPPTPPTPATAPSAAPAARAAAPSAPAAAAAPADFGLARTGAQAAGNSISSHLPGDFYGWEPNARLRLANGQVWQVVDGSRAAYALRDPVVRVRRSPLGHYVLEVEGANRTARVRRVE